MAFEKLDAYNLIKEEFIKDLNSMAYILSHKKTKARIFLLSNDDDNKVFTIGFRTPPENSTGVAHIMEHSVLCGSKKFPLKDPFVELVKGSLNTFLNAMTYPDKTVYPVASCNDKDFQNLMDVYMDAVLNPCIYDNEKIFRQEGWHYEMESLESPLTINGVVYNEMKGAYSSPEGVLEQNIQSGLFPETPYNYESGGDPDFIPELSYEEFINFHKKYYHPSNSYIYIYGNMDMEEKLEWLDREYLSKYEYLDVDSKINIQKAFEKPVRKTLSYSAKSKDDASYLAIAMTAGDKFDSKKYLASDVLDYVLLGAPGAPLKQALLDKNIGKDVYGGIENSYSQPYFSVVVKDASKDQMEDFIQTVNETLETLVLEGLNKKTLKAGLNVMEFKVREADYGQFPKGLMYGLQCFDSWLYDENEPLMYLKFEDNIKWIREHIDDNYFENIIKTWLMNNPHQVQIIMNPDTELDKVKEKALSDKLDKIKKSMTEADINKIISEYKELKAYQETPNTPEELKCIPMLSRDDIKKEAYKPINREENEDDVKIIYHDIFTGGIGYTKILFNLSGLMAEELQYATLLCSMLFKVDTKKFKYRELSDEINMNCGGMACAPFSLKKSNEEFLAYLSLVSKSKTDGLDFVFNMFEEVVCNSDFSDKKRIREIILQLGTRIKTSMVSAGHSTAVTRSMASSGETSGIYAELTGGVEYARFILKLADEFEEKSDYIISKLDEVRNKIFRPSNMIVSYTSDYESSKLIKAPLKLFTENIGRAFKDGKKHSSDCNKKLSLNNSKVPDKKEALITASQVQYVARTGNFENKGFKYKSALRILNVILNYDYMWINVRVKGGAYGCMSGFSQYGTGYFVSYRDPNIAETNEVYINMPEYIRNFDADEREMTKYIIGTISELDTPKTPRTSGEVSLRIYLTGEKYEDIQKRRDELLSCTSKDIRGLSEIIEAILSDERICVVGSENKINENKNMFDHIEELF